MANYFLNGPGMMVLLLFYWVPFALGAYFADVWEPEPTRRMLQKVFHPIRHVRHMRAAHAH